MTKGASDSLVVAITGGAGFIGAALARRLVSDGHRVRCLDVAAFDRLQDLGDHERVELVTGDVRDAGAVADLVSGADRVVHLAAVVGVERYLDDPLAVLDVGILGTRQVLQACLDAGVPVVVGSSSESLGRQPGRLAEDRGRAFGPVGEARWSYAISKAAGEHYAAALASAGLSCLILRYFNVYGPGMDAPGRGRVLPRFAGALRDGKPLALVDGGFAVRSFCYVDDAVEATARAVVQLERGGDLDGQTLHVGASDAVAIRELAELVLALTGSDVGTVDTSGGVVYGGSGFADIPHRVPDVARAQQLLGFRAETPLVEGLRRTLRDWGLPADGDVPPGRTVPAVKPTIEPDEALMARLADVLDSGRLSNHGPHERALERELAAWTGGPEVVALASGTAAIELSLRALDVQRGSVVLPAWTFAATLNAARACGLEPVFCDIDPATWTMDPDDLRRALRTTRNVKAVIPVSTFGAPPPLELIGEMAAEAGAVCVYDGCHALGTEVGGARWQVHARVQAVSLHATKLVAAGEGGAVITSEPEVAAALRQLRDHGLSADRTQARPGTNAKLSELHAAVARHSLAAADAAIARRRAYADRLEAHLAHHPGVYRLQRFPEGVRTNRQNLGVQVRVTGEPELERWIGLMASRGVEARRYFWPTLSRLFGTTRRLPVTMALAASHVILPLHSRMSEGDLARVEDALSFAAEELRR